MGVEGALFSTGDGHFAQGDGEVCVTAVEMGATAVVRFRVLKGTGAARAMRAPRFSHPGYFAPPEWASRLDQLETALESERPDTTQVVDRDP